MQFNTEQQEAILHKKGPALVLAGPGSGKTTVITGRIAALLSVYHIPPSQILVLSFTRAASREIEDRFRRQYADAPVRFGTIHAIFYRILKISRPGADFSVLPAGLRRRWAEELLTEVLGEAAWPREQISQTELFLRQGGRKPGADAFFLEEAAGQRLLEAYRQKKRQEGYLDFEDMLKESLRLFSEKTETLGYWQQQFSYILVDEYQDTSPLQLDLLKALAGPSGNIFAVGDDDQSIYAFRGADSSVMLRFGHDFPGAAFYRLSACYRCSPQVLAAASSLISCNRHRYMKHLLSMALPGSSPELQLFSDVGEETRGLLRQIGQAMEKGMVPAHMAVLTRSRFALRRVAAALAGRGIPFVCDEGLEADHAHWIGEDLFAYLRLSQGENQRSHYLQILHKPPRYISRDLFREACPERNAMLARLWERPRAAANLMKLFQDLDRIREMKPFAAVEYIRREMGYETYLRDYAALRHIAPEPFLMLLDRLQQEGAGFSRTAEWIQAREVLLSRGGQRGGEARAGVRLMTMHGAKGLEFEQVFLPFLNEEEIPGNRSVQEMQLEEERRLLYVAMTRAKKVLWMSCSKEKRGGHSRPSRFLKEIQGLQLRSGN